MHLKPGHLAQEEEGGRCGGKEGEGRKRTLSRCWIFKDAGNDTYEEDDEFKMGMKF